MRRFSKLLLLISFIFIGVFSVKIECINLFISQANAEGFDSAVLGRHGRVLARGLELRGGKPIWVEINDEGEVVSEIGVASDKLSQAFPLSGSVYQEYGRVLRNLYDSALDVEVLSRDQYLAKDFGVIEVPRLNPAPGQSQTEPVRIPKPELDPLTKSVVVRTRQTIIDPRLLPDSGPIVFEAPIDLRAWYYQEISNSIKSVLIDNLGQVAKLSTHNIGFKSGFFHSNDPDEEGDPLGPVKGAKVDAGVYTYRGIHAVTDASGWYGLKIHKPPCPGFSYLNQFDITATFAMRDFNPEAGDFLDITYAGTPDFLVCTGLSAYFSGVTSPLGGGIGMLEAAVKTTLRSIEIVTELANNQFDRDVRIYVDSIMFSGVARIANEEDDSVVPVTDVTEYDYTAPSLEYIKTPNLDLNADRRDDFIILEGNLQHVYFNAVGQNSAGQAIDADGNIIEKPDVTRLADIKAQFEDQGLLKSISEDDLKKTDIYIYRASNGLLIAKRNELQDYNLEIEGDDHFYYRFPIPGSKFSDLCSGCGEGASRDERREAWQEAQNVADELRPYKADHLRPGEQVKIIAINRPTGYIGSVLATVQPVQDGRLDFQIPTIIMRAPNLKVRIERVYTVAAGLTEGLERTYDVAFSGSALTTDTMVKIHTEWFDNDGKALPDDLEGYSARLAKSTGSNSLAGGDFSTFKIEPGSKLQVAKFKGDVLGTEHFYLHVSGFPDWENPGIGAASSGPLQYRPKNYVPIKVPLYDEESTRLLRNYNAYNFQDGRESIRTVAPVYKWKVRPEMQFSVFELKQNELEIRYDDENGSQQRLNLSTDPLREVSDVLTNYSAIELLYGLIQGGNDPLDPIDLPRQLSFAIGGEEVLVGFNERGELEFDQLAHLAELDFSMMTGIRLFQNSDVENILWEYELPILYVAMDLNRDGKVEFGYEYDFEELEEDSAEGRQIPTDKTTPLRPYRFWINNDFDVVSLYGNNTPTQSCGGLPAPTDNGIVEQVCEVWDASTQNGQHNTARMNLPQDNGYTHLEVIDNNRDLEDFTPFAIQLNSAGLGTEYILEIKGNGVGINLFAGAWNDDNDEKAHAYIYDHRLTLNQMTKDRGDYYVGYAAPGGKAIEITHRQFNRFFDQDGVGRFVLEGVDASDQGCTDDATDCFVKISLVKLKNRQREVVIEKKLFLDLHDINDFYQSITAGSVDSGDDNSNTAFHAAYNGQPIGDMPGLNENNTHIYKGLYDDGIDKHYTLLVHGWRMRDSEKLQFAETTFKRLYWSGYKGSFGSLSWPTGWHEKPGHLYGLYQLPYLSGNKQNYNISEIVARRVGVALVSWLANLSRFEKKHVIAHSMGNVVVSETLHHFQGSGLIDNYVAMEAAEVGGSYSQNLHDISHCLIFDVGVCETSDRSGPYNAWDWYNSPNQINSSFHMPPDKYRYDVDVVHSGTHDDFMAAQNNPNGPRSGLHYYTGIGSYARIFNMFNATDAALNGWELNQLTKPDSSDGPTWLYAYLSVNCGVFCENGELVRDRFFREQVNSPPPNTFVDYTWSDEIPVTEETMAIMGHIIPARTNALGQVLASHLGNTEISEDRDLFFTSSNQDHSAQFHGYLSEPRAAGVQSRRRFWNLLLTRGLLLSPAIDGDLTELKNF